MKSLKLFLVLIVLTGMNSSCSAQTQKKEDSNPAARLDKVVVYYFHYTRRCATCNAVEQVSREAITELYGNKVSFSDFNLDEKEGEARGEKLGVSGQTLLIVSGETKIDITNEGFLNARSNPDKLKQTIKEKIDPLL